jgi:hypothetical protein
MAAAAAAVPRLERAAMRAGAAPDATRRDAIASEEAPAGRLATAERRAASAARDGRAGVRRTAIGAAESTA